MLDQKILYEIFEYREGLLYRKKKTSRTTKVGSEVLSYTTKGKTFSVHRIIFMMFHGYLPPIVGFKDLNAKNTRIENLRAFLNRSKIGFTQRKRRDNTSGYKGVSWHHAAKKWCSKIRINTKSICLGYFTDKEEAFQAYCRAVEKYNLLK